MNKILGIAIFLIIVVSSISIAFAAHSDDNGSESSNVASVANEDNVANENSSGVPISTPDDTKKPATNHSDDKKQSLYDDVIAKKGVYDSINRSNYQNDSEYFESLTIAWRNYVDVLALYDNTNDSVILKAKLSNSINAYLKTCEEIENLYNDVKYKKTIYDEKLNDFRNDEKYFKDLLDTWKNYLDALFRYDDSTPVDFWFNLMNKTITDYQNNFNEIKKKYDGVVNAMNNYMDELHAVNYHLASNIETNDYYFDSLRSAWISYVDALFDHNNTASSDFNILKAKINESIASYLEDSNINLNRLKDVNDSKIAYENEFLNVKDHLASHIVNESSYFNDLRSTWKDYWELWDDYYNTILLVQKLIYSMN